MGTYHYAKWRALIASLLLTLCLSAQSSTGGARQQLDHCGRLKQTNLNQQTETVSSTQEETYGQWKQNGFGYKHIKLLLTLSWTF